MTERLEWKTMKYNGSIQKAFKILERFTLEKPEWGVTELAKAVGSNKSTIYRMLATLEQLGVIRQNTDSDKYSLGLKLFELGNRVKIHASFVKQTHSELEKVAEDIRETVHLAILKNNQVFYIDKAESPQGLAMSTNIGTYRAAHATSLGKVLLAFIPNSSLEVSINKLLINNSLPKITNHTITEKSTLITALQKVKNQGYAIDREEFEIGLICVAIPVFNQKNEVVASLSASGPANRFEEAEIEKYVGILKNGADAIRLKIGNFSI
ncbi:MAG: IclR family KDG regulon transcriptional repressor [Cognaticolwellia sp.]|jgi:IclR family KDG regulon transcriptional repressor